MGHVLYLLFGEFSICYFGSWIIGPWLIWVFGSFVMLVYWSLGVSLIYISNLVFGDWGFRFIAYLLFGYFDNLSMLLFGNVLYLCSFVN